jgi:glycopeptide antibiotics resistance protein
VLASTLVAFIVGGWVGRRVGSGRLIGMLLIVALGLIVSATLTPSREALRFGALGSGTCDLTRIRLAPLSEVLVLHDAGFNVLLYVPLGLVVGSMRPRWTGVGWFLAAGLLSPAIEAIQMLLRPLDRACQASDVIDNVTGFVIGVAFAVAIRMVLSLLWPDPPRASDAPPVPGA